MNSIKFLGTIVFSFICFQGMSQGEPPKGFREGKLFLADNTVIEGYIKNNMRSNASVVLISKTGGKKKEYDGNEIVSVVIDAEKFVSIRGDFFKVICEGELSFLQKSSDASGKPSYNGAEPVFSNGTAGKPGDFFIYDEKSKQLQLVTKKTFDSVVAESFADCAPAIDKAKNAKTDIPQLKEAVVIYNSRNMNH